MSATHDKTVQIQKVGALVELTEEVLTHGIGFISAEYPPLLMTFTRDAKGNVNGYSVDPIKPESKEVQKVNFVHVDHVPEKKPAIIGLNGKGPKIIMPG